MSRRLGIASALAVGMVVMPRAVAAFSCSSVDPAGCPQPGATCFVACAEDDVRAVLELVNRCAASAVTLAMGPDAATTCGATPIPLRMDPTAPATAAGSCGDDHANRYNALCLAATGIVFDGRGAVFQYVGDHVCASCDGECTLCPGERCASRQPALFVVRGSRNTVRNLEMRFFPEGIHLRAGDAHAVEQVTSRWVCEEAITVDEGSGHRVSDGTLVGNTDAADGGGQCWVRVEDSACATDGDCRPGARCYCGGLAGLGACATPPPPPLWPADTPGQCYAPARCGHDKAIQVNGGQAAIERNRIDAFSQPVSVLAGSHVIAGNVSCGDRRDRNVCQAYGVRGGSVTFRGNRIDHCKFGIRLDGAAQVDAVDNVITNGWVSAFQLKGQGAARLRAEGNHLRNNGHSTESDCQRGSLVVTGNALARVDFGGGDGAGLAVLAGPPSAGGNVSCQAESGAPHVWNGTPCACTGGCVEAGASVGLGGDAFSPGLVLPPAADANVVDGPPLETRVTDASRYDACEAIVVDECECPEGECAPPAGTLVVSRVVVRPERDGSTVIVRGMLVGRAPGDGFALEMPGVLADAVTWRTDDCGVAGSGRITCSAAAGAARARFAPRGPDTYLFRLVLAAPTLAPRSGGDLTVMLAYDGTRHIGSLPASACRVRDLGFRCRER
jgi:hypothetical protein